MVQSNDSNKGKCILNMKTLFKRERSYLLANEFTFSVHCRLLGWHLEYSSFFCNKLLLLFAWIHSITIYHYLRRSYINEKQHQK